MGRRRSTRKSTLRVTPSMMPLFYNYVILADPSAQTTFTGTFEYIPTRLWVVTIHYNLWKEGYRCVSFCRRCPSHLVPFFQFANEPSHSHNLTSVLEKKDIKHTGMVNASSIGYIVSISCCNSTRNNMIYVGYKCCE